MFASYSQLYSEILHFIPFKYTRKDTLLCSTDPIIIGKLTQNHAKRGERLSVTFIITKYR